MFHYFEPSCIQNVYFLVAKTEMRQTPLIRERLFPFCNKDLIVNQKYSFRIIIVLVFL